MWKVSQWSYRHATHGMLIVSVLSDGSAYAYRIAPGERVEEIGGLFADAGAALEACERYVRELDAALVRVA